MQELFQYATIWGHVNLLDVLWSLRLEMGLVVVNVTLCIWGLGLEMRERRQVRQLRETTEVRA